MSSRKTAWLIFHTEPKDVCLCFHCNHATTLPIFSSFANGIRSRLLTTILILNAGICAVLVCHFIWFRVHRKSTHLCVFCCQAQKQFNLTICKRYFRFSFISVSMRRLNRQWFQWFLACYFMHMFDCFFGFILLQKLNQYLKRVRLSHSKGAQIPFRVISIQIGWAVF